MTLYQEFLLSKKLEEKTQILAQKKHDTIPRILTSQEVGGKKNSDHDQWPTCQMMDPKVLI